MASTTQHNPSGLYVVGGSYRGRRYRKYVGADKNLADVLQAGFNDRIRTLRSGYPLPSGVSLREFLLDGKTSYGGSVLPYPPFEPGRARLARNRYTHVYFIWSDRARRIKIGISSNVGDRVRSLSTASPDGDFSVMGTLEMPDRDRALAEERRIHDDLAAYRVHGEWFEASLSVESYVAVKLGLADPVRARYDSSLDDPLDAACAIVNLVTDPGLMRAAYGPKVKAIQLTTEDTVATVQDVAESIRQRCSCEDHHQA